MLNILCTGIFDSREKFKTANKTPLRKTEHYELEFYLSSNGTAILNDIEYPHKKGLTLFIAPGTSRCSSGSFSCFYIHFIPDENILSLIKDFETFSTLQPFYLSEQFLKIIELFNSDDVTSRLALESEVLKLLKDVLFKEKSAVSEDIQKAKQYIKENFANDIDLEDIARAVNMSATYLHKKFKKSFGITPREYILELRIKEAKKLLLTSDMPLYEISEICGFSSQAYFNARFKASVGLPPGEFRNTRYEMPD